jgi:catechol 2,3-dioxygenase-like lactoylglutathione lyase family enzyme
MLRGLTTVTFFADDLTAAQRWYTEVLGIEPYFSRSVDGTPAYIEFRIGDYQHELGFIDSRFAPHGRSGKAGGAVPGRGQHGYATPSGAAGPRVVALSRITRVTLG